MLPLRSASPLGCNVLADVCGGSELQRCLCPAEACQTLVGAWLSQGVVEALLSGKEGVSSAARRFRLRCLKHVILLLGQQPAGQPLAGSGPEGCSASAQQQVPLPCTLSGASAGAL